MSAAFPFVASADPLAGIAHMLGHPFEVRAFVAGSLIAAAAGLVGYFVVLRNQVFTGDALSHVAFTGALAALAAGVDLRIGLFVGCVVFGLAMAALGRNGRADDVVIGNVFAWVLGLGVFFLTIYTTGGASGRGGANNGSAGINVLFGSIFGLTSSQTTVAAIIAAGVILAMIGLARPLLFASLDPSVASARGIPVGALGLVFLALVGVTAGEATQAVGSLLLLGLLAAPAGAARHLTDRPFVAMWTSAGIAVLAMWGGLTIAYAASQVPPSFAIMAVAAAAYLAAAGVQAVRGRRSRGRRRGVRPASATVRV